MTTTINASTSAGLVQTADTSGVLALQTAGTTAISIDASQAVTMSGRTSNPTTISVGGATPSTSGSGITFPATQSASTNANTLDDYEEGTFTPTITSSSGSLTSYTSAGIYVKVGQAVTVNFGFSISTTGTAGGSAVVTGLPFQDATAPVGNRLAIGVVRENAATGFIYQFYIDSGGTSGNTLTLTNAAITWGNGYQYEYTITYQSAA
jgi:hypothetical protein